MFSIIPINDVSKEIATKTVVRESMIQGGKRVLDVAVRRGVSMAVQQSLRNCIRIGSSPMLWVADVAEVAIDKYAGAPKIAKSTSLGMYVATGAVLGGGVGAVVTTGMWTAGQVIQHLRK